MTALDKLYLAPSQTCTGQVVLPGSKSIANRALLMAALCDTPTVLTNLLVSDDTRHMRKALADLGVAQQELSDNGQTLQVNGCGGNWTLQPGELFLGNAGTAVRPLTAVLAATSKHPVVITGEPRMLERPLAPLIDALVLGGADIKSTGISGYPPVTVAGGLQGGAIQVDGSASSQFISALLMALPLAPNHSVLTLTGTIVSWPYIELTLAMLNAFGIEITKLTENSFEIAGGQRYRSPGEYWIEGDASAASYWLAAGVIGGGPVQVEGAGSQSLQGDVAFAEVLQRMGANITIQPHQMIAAGVTEQHGRLQGIDVDLNAIPDAAMTLATLALFAEGPTRIRNVANWRLKETDRCWQWPPSCAKWVRRLVCLTTAC